MNPLVTLAPVSLLLGAAMMWVFRRTTHRQALSEAVNRIQAHLVEFCLFADEPALVWKFWRDLLAANVRFIGLLLVPLLILTVPMAPLFFLLDSIYGHSPLVIGSSALVTIGLVGDTPGPSVLHAPEGIRVESPPVRVFSPREVSWRIRPDRPLSGRLRITVNGETVEKSIKTGSGFAWLSPKRVHSLIELIRYPTEKPLEAGPVKWVEVAYPTATVALFGLAVHWSIWFVALSLAGALLSPR